MIINLADCAHQNLFHKHTFMDYSSFLGSKLKVFFQGPPPLAVYLRGLPPGSTPVLTPWFQPWVCQRGPKGQLKSLGVWEAFKPSVLGLLRFFSKLALALCLLLLLCLFTYLVLDHCSAELGMDKKYEQLIVYSPYSI